MTDNTACHVPMFRVLATTPAQGDYAGDSSACGFVVVVNAPTWAVPPVSKPANVMSKPHISWCLWPGNPSRKTNNHRSQIRGRRQGGTAQELRNQHKRKERKVGSPPRRKSKKSAPGNARFRHAAYPGSTAGNGRRMVRRTAGPAAIIRGRKDCHAGIGMSA